MKKNKPRKLISIWISFLVFLFMLIIAFAISACYFYFEAKKGIAEIETNTRNYSTTLVEAFANMAEMAYGSKDFKKLKTIFREKIQASLIDEAFFVLTDGTIIVHSDKEKEKELMGNIASDEFAYNIDLIMLPVWTKTGHAQFLDYYIYGNEKKIPFNKEIIKYIKKYIYAKIDVHGWLVTRAVFNKNAGVGCVSFIISKEKIYSFLREHFEKSYRLFLLLAALIAVFQIILMIIIARYRSIKYKQVQTGIIEMIKSENLPDKPPGGDHKKRLKEPIRVKDDAGQKPASDNRKIKDAILINNK